ncbi:hypothetical protein KIN20_020089 [Parelaphostrongylus tenuis]|uniref:WD repeat-containing protein 4 homolog n=1 Tax=Parelaphostrongylus tenuis TaxID=148309 RepID=A0AAD5QTC3_PARTN|nr:hypothetical protein KIN20_020089 [Parelaphostrongylus tenuis]
MATVHKLDGGLLICASSSVFLAKYSHDRLSIDRSFNTKGVLKSLLSTKELADGDVKQPSTATTDDVDVQILCSNVSNCGSLLALGTSEKVLIILEAHTLTMRRGFRVPKAPTSVTFDKDDAHVVVGDRAGHVRRYSIKASENCGYTDMNGEESISHDGNFLLAADRDEKIRVSRYPQTYVIQSYCLGHSAYVSSLALLGNRLFSSGGDSIVIEWELECGKVVTRSEKLDELPVRRILAFEQDKTLFVVAAAGPTLHILDEHLQSVSSINHLRQ